MCYQADTFLAAVKLYVFRNPWKEKEIQAIEAIQRTFTYKITEVQHLNYFETQIVLST